MDAEAQRFRESQNCSDSLLWVEDPKDGLARISLDTSIQPFSSFFFFISQTCLYLRAPPHLSGYLPIFFHTDISLDKTFTLIQSWHLLLGEPGLISLLDSLRIWLFEESVTLSEHGGARVSGRMVHCGCLVLQQDGSQGRVRRELAEEGSVAVEANEA